MLTITTKKKKKHEVFGGIESAASSRREVAQKEYTCKVKSDLNPKAYNSKSHTEDDLKSKTLRQKLKNLVTTYINLKILFSLDR